MIAYSGSIFFCSLLSHLLVHSVGSAVGYTVSEVYDLDTYPVPGTSTTTYHVDPVDPVGYVVGEVSSSLLHWI